MLKDDDVLVRNRYRARGYDCIVAAPLSALDRVRDEMDYDARHFGGGCRFVPIPELWENVLRTRTHPESWTLNRITLKPEVRPARNYKWHFGNLVKFDICSHCGCHMATIATGWNRGPAPVVCSTRCEVERERQRQRVKGAARPKAAMHASTCQHCGEAFTAKRADARFCGVKCRVAAHRAA